MSSCSNWFKCLLRKFSLSKSLPVYALLKWVKFKSTLKSLNTKLLFVVSSSEVTCGSPCPSSLKC